jgi:hypothetical protein
VHEHVRRYLDGAAAAAFVVVWAALGFEIALLAAAAALAAAHWRRLTITVPRRPKAPRRRREPVEPLPLVPDDPSLILTPAEL